MRAQQRHAGEDEVRVVERGGAAARGMIARDGHAVRGCERALEAPRPIRACVVDARAPEGLGRERQHDVRLAAQLARGFQEEKVGAACGRAVHRGWREGRHPVHHLLTHARLVLRRKSRRRAAGRIDHVSRKGHDRRNGERGARGLAGAGKMVLQEARLPARGADVAVVASGERERSPVARACVGDIAEDQSGFRERGLLPVVARPREACRADLARERVGTSEVSAQHRHRRRVDARVSGGRVLAPRARCAVRTLVRFERRLEVGCPLGGFTVQCEVLVGTPQEAERLPVLVALGGKPRHDRIRAADVAPPRQCEPLQLAQAQVIGPALEGGLQRVVRGEGLALAQLALGGLDDRFRLVHPAQRMRVADDSRLSTDHVITYPKPPGSGKPRSATSGEVIP